MADNILSDFGINLLEEEVDDEFDEEIAEESEE